ncbi:MAG TPA: DUF6600 domain-containing protein [Ramlibacter sp.]|jgi:hypothetical protein
MNTPSKSIGFVVAARWLALLAFATIGSIALAQQEPGAPSDAQADPPARVGAITAAQGSIVFAPAGETDWAALPHNRPIVKGDRLWTDDGARAEVSFGSSVLHMASRTFVEVIAIDDNVVQLAVNQGSVNARARDLRAGDNFEISTPQLALRATQPGDWRIDVDPQQGFTRVTAHGGVALLYGADGNVQRVVAGQQVAFSGRDLLAAANVPPAADDGFERWALDRNRAEDQSLAARYIPRDVVGSPELDAYGSWSQDPDWGTVWYPQVVSADWAPYRYGHWDWIAPWGWTWIDDAPWGFAPFHYGRWTMIDSRWAWVPGPLGRHPVYAPALVAFVGGGPSIGWYPLAPGEIWRPWWTASPAYVRDVNRYLVTDSRFYNTGPHLFGHRPDAITAVRGDDFGHGRAVQSHWSRMRPQDIARAQPATPPAPLREARREFPREQQRSMQPRPMQPLQREQFLQPRAERPREPQARPQQQVRETQRRQFVQQRQQREQRREIAVQRQERHAPAQPRGEQRAAQRQAQRDEGHGRRFQ